MSSDPPAAPVTNNYEESMREALQAQIDLAPDLYQAEKGYAKNEDTGEYEYVGGGRLDYAKLQGEIRREALTGINGIASLLAGDQKTQFADGLRKAGFDKDGNFKGAAGLEEDLRARAKENQVKQEVALASQYQNTLTKALRGGDYSGLTSAIKNFTAKANESSAVDDIEKPVFGNLAQAQVMEGKLGRLDTNNYQGRYDSIEAPKYFNPNVSADEVSANQINNVNQVTSSNVSSQDALSSTVSADAIGDLGGLRSGLTNAATADLALGGDLSADERRQIEQDARAAASARGRLRDTSSIVDEVANMESARRARRNERRQFAQSVAGQESQLREGEVGRDLQAGLANQQTGLQASLANTDRDLQAQLANQQSSIQAQMANQAQNFQMDKANQDASLQADLANQGVDLQAQQISRENELADNQMNLQAQGMEAERLAQLNALRQQGDLANMQTEMDVGRMRIAAREKDLDRGIAIDQVNQANQMQALAQDRAALQNLINVEQTTSADAFMALTGRPSGQTVTSGQSAYGNTGSAIAAAPTLYNPSQGAQFDANQSSMINSYNAATYGAQQARSGAIIGGIAGGLGALGGGMLACWVAREVYGPTNVKWLAFRHWMYYEGPSWFRFIYLKYGEMFASFISDKPKLKKRIKAWMDSKIKEII